MDFSAQLSNTQQSSADQSEMGSAQTINRIFQNKNSHESERGEANRNKDNRQKNQDFKRQRKIRQAIKADAASGNEAPYPKYYSLKFPRLEIEKINVIAVDRNIRETIGEPAEIKKQNKDTLLIKVRSRNQGSLLKEVTTIAGHEVAVFEHKALNQSKGTVFSETLSNIPVQEIEEALQDQHVIKVEKMKRRVNGELQDTNRYIITFNKPDLPRSISITKWHHELVELYIPRPMRCSKCQRLGHTQKYCRREQIVCVKCGEDGHRLSECTKEESCINCGEKHFSSSNKCPKFIFQSEVLATQARTRSAYHEAQEEVRGRFREEGKTYSFVTRRPPPSQRRETPAAQQGPHDRQRREPITSRANQEPPSTPSRSDETTSVSTPDEQTQPIITPTRPNENASIQIPTQPSTSAIVTNLPAATEPTPLDSSVTEHKEKTNTQKKVREPTDVKSKKAKTNKEPKDGIESSTVNRDHQSETPKNEWTEVKANTANKIPPLQKYPPRTSNRFEKLSEENMDKDKVNQASSRKRERKDSPGEEKTVTKKQQAVMNNPITTVIGGTTQHRSQRGSKPPDPPPPPKNWI